MQVKHSWFPSSNTTIKSHYKYSCEVLENLRLYLCMCGIHSKKLQSFPQSPSSPFCTSSLITCPSSSLSFIFEQVFEIFNQHFLLLQWFPCLRTISLDPEASLLLYWLCYILLGFIQEVRPHFLKQRPEESPPKIPYDLFLGVMLQNTSSNSHLTVLSVHWILVQPRSVNKQAAYRPPALSTAPQSRRATGWNSTV